MTVTPRLPDLALKVYILLLEGKAQSSIARSLGVRRQKINYYVQKLLGRGYLVPVKSSTPVKKGGGVAFYQKGPEAYIMDGLILERNVLINARGVNPCPTPEPPLTMVHHMKFRLNVIKEGDLEYLAEFKDGVRVLRPFLKPYMTNYRGISRYSGRIPYRDGEVTVEYETTPKTRSIYLYAPKIMLTAQQVREKQHIRLGIQSCLEMARWIQTVGGWKLGLPEVTDWKVHYGVDDRVEFGEIAGRVYARTPDRKTWISDSEGRTEWETCDPDLVQIRLMLPQEVLNLKKELSQLQEAIPQTFEAFRKEVLDFKREVGSLLQDFRTSLLNDIFGCPSKDKAEEGRDETQGLMYR